MIRLFERAAEWWRGVQARSAAVDDVLDFGPIELPTRFGGGFDVGVLEEQREEVRRRGSGFISGRGTGLKRGAIVVLAGEPEIHCRVRGVRYYGETNDQFEAFVEMADIEPD
jgi:hypothetical protein